MDEIRLDNIEEINLNMDSLPSTNFGPGAELLMNGKQLEGPKEISITDLDSLERELNDLADKPSSSSFQEATRNMFNVPMQSVKFNEPVKEEFKETTKTWDGYTSSNDYFETEKKSELSKEDTLREKFKYLRKLEELQSKGVNLTKSYSMESPLDEMQGEYEHIMAEKERSNSVKFQGKMLMACITGLEFLNHKFDPFDLKLDGWAEQVNENIDDYDEIFAELHEKYKSKARMAPELKLLFQLGGGAIMLHMTNTMFKSSMPGLDDIMRQNPELMQKFTQAAVNTMGNQSPGFSGFMNSMMPEPRMDTRPPPRAEPRVERETRNSQRAEPKRAEMKGPTDISDILGGLKSKTIHITEKEGSTISLSELKEMHESMDIPKSKRRGKSEKNTFNLNL